MLFIKKWSFLIFTVNFLMIGISYGTETYPESKDSSPPAVTSEVTPQETNRSGFIEKMEHNLQQAIREERLATLSELDKERRATLIYMTHERLAATEDLKSELNRLTETFVSERKATLTEIEAIGDRLVSRSLIRSKSLIDHFFIRLFQLILFIGVVTTISILLIKRSHVKRNAIRTHQ